MADEQLESHSEEAFGVGSVPASLNRVNWGAFFFGWVWAAAYGMWAWFVLLFGYWVSSRYILNLADLMMDGIPPAFSTLVALGTWGLPALFALRANRLMWTHQQERLEGASRPAVGRPPADIAQYLSSQRAWAWAGLALYAASTALTAPWEVFGGTWTEIPPLQIYNLVGLAVIAALLLWDRLASAKLTSASS